MPEILIDGNYLQAEPIGAPRWQWPFRKDGDRVTAFFEQDYWQTLATFTPQELIVPHPTLTGFYLIKETAPMPMTCDVWQFTRTWSRIPATQTLYGTLSFTKPAFPTNDYSGYYVDSTAALTLANVWNLNVTPSAVLRFATGGTFTVTYKTSTTAGIAYNASNGTIETAVNALADLVTDASTITASNLISSTGYLVFTRATGAADIGTDMSSSVASITPASGVTNTASSPTSLSLFVQRNAITFTKTAHGLAAAQAIRVNSATTGAGTATTVLAVTDADNFTVTNALSYAQTTWAYYRILLRTYTPGLGRARTKKISTFALPGVSAGITTAGDISTPSDLLNDADFLAAVLANPTGYVTYDVDDLIQWMDSTIWELDYVQINMADL